MKKLIICILCVMCVISSCGVQEGVGVENLNDNTYSSDAEENNGNDTLSFPYSLLDFDSVSEAFLLDGHPTYMGDIGVALEYKIVFEEGMIRVDESFTYTSKCIMTVESHASKDIDNQISRIELYFHQPKYEGAFLDVFKVVDGYLGSDIYEQYQFSESNKYYKDDLDSTTYYTIVYKKIVEYSGEKHYFGSVYVRIQEKNERIDVVVISHSLPNYLFNSNAVRNGYTIEPWSEWAEYKELSSGE